MNEFIIAGMTLEKENQFSTPFLKKVRWEIVFHFFHLFSHIFTHLMKGEKNICHSEQKKSLLFQ